MSKIVVTGGAGYIGSSLVEHLLDKDNEVVLYDIQMFGVSDKLKSHESKGLKIVRGDILNTTLLAESITSADAVIHLAALANDPAGELDEKLTIDINYCGLKSVIEAAIVSGARRVLYISSSSVYGCNEKIGLTELDRPSPIKLYSRLKYYGELMTRDFAMEKGLHVSSLRLGTVCGWSHRMRFDLVLNKMIAQAIEDRAITVYGGDQTRPHIHIQDVVELLSRLALTDGDLLAPGKVYNVCGENVTINQIAESIVGRMNVVDVKHVESSDSVDMRSYNVSSDDICSLLNYTFSRTVSRSIDDIYEAYINGKWRDYKKAKYHNIASTKLFWNM